MRIAFLVAVPQVQQEPADADLHVLGGAQSVQPVHLRQGIGGEYSPVVDDVVEGHHDLVRLEARKVGCGGACPPLPPAIGNPAAPRVHAPVNVSREVEVGQPFAVQPVVPVNAGHIDVPTAEEASEVVPHLLGGDGPLGELPEVLAEPRRHGAGPPDDGLEVGQKEAPLFVGDAGERVIGAALAQVRLQPRVIRTGLEGVHRFDELKVPEGEQQPPVAVPVHLPQDAPLDIPSEALVEPEVRPRRVRDPVARPRVGDLMGERRGQAAVAGDQGRREEGQVRVLHAAVREGPRQDQHVEGAPLVRQPTDLLRLQDERLRHAIQLRPGGLEQLGLRVHCAARSNGFLVKVPTAHRHEIRHDGHGLLVAEGAGLCLGVDHGVAHQIATGHRHQMLGDGDSEGKRRFDCGGVLAGKDGASQNGLALCKAEGMLLARRLLWSQPLHGLRFYRCAVRNTDFGRIGLGELDPESPSELVRCGSVKIQRTVVRSIRH